MTICFYAVQFDRRFGDFGELGRAVFRSMVRPAASDWPIAQKLASLGAALIANAGPAETVVANTSRPCSTAILE